MGKRVDVMVASPVTKVCEVSVPLFAVNNLSLVILCIQLLLYNDEQRIANAQLQSGGRLETQHLGDTGVQTIKVF